MQVIILGDPHLNKSANLGKTHLGSKINSRVNDQLNLLDWVLDTAIEQDVDHIIITGDVFEEPKPPTDIITLFISWLKKCRAHNISVHIIIGNHDILRTGLNYSSPLDIISECDIEGIEVYKDISTIILGKSAFTLVPFRDRKSLLSNSNLEALKLLEESFIYEVAGMPITYKKVMVGHLAIEGSIPVGDEIDDIANELMCPLSIFKNYDFVWMGHVHNHQVLSKIPYISHIGSMDISNFGESNHKKHIVIYDTDSGNFSHKILPTRNLLKIQIEINDFQENSTEYVIDEIKNKNLKLADSIVRVEILLNDINLKSVDRSKIEKYLLENNVFIVVGIQESKKTIIIKKKEDNKINTDMNIVSAIKEYANKYIDDKNRSYFQELALEIYKEYQGEE